MKQRWIIPAFVLIAAVACLPFACGDDDDDDGGGPAAGSDVCSDLGDLPVSSGTMTGGFTFDGASGSFPLSITLDGDNRQLTGTLSFSDSGSSYSGNCAGYWDLDGYLFGSCGATNGSDFIDIDIFGDIGENGSCGAWNNDFGQSGDYWVAR
ncbi:MAG: hypothetical protein P9L99_09630 [Candidatus Lernaella stagnicola]|nr:hypothetical protein [Candidatus Lernaella stagnicola]